MNIYTSVFLGIVVIGLIITNIKLRKVFRWYIFGAFWLLVIIAISLYLSRFFSVEFPEVLDGPKVQNTHRSQPPSPKPLPELKSRSPVPGFDDIKTDLHKELGDFESRKVPNK